MSDSFVQRFRRSKNWPQYKRVLRALSLARSRLPVDRIARIAGCEPRQVYGLMQRLKPYLIRTDNLTLSNVPQEGYCLTQNLDQRMDEARKSQMRGIGHLKSASRTLQTVSKSEIHNQDDVEIYGKYVAVDALYQALAGIKGEIRSMLVKQQDADSVRDPQVVPIKLRALDEDA